MDEETGGKLSGLETRAAFEAALESTLANIRGEETSARAPIAEVSLIVLDVDHLRQVNERLGHPAGDEVLHQVSGIILSANEAGASAARFEGGEFVVLLPDMSARDATAHAEKIRARIAALRFDKYPTLIVTASLGVACSRDAGTHSSQLIKNADYVLYQAKGNGRNRVETYS